ncbi:MAG TPA: class I SAM-dependent methyltransferase [Bacillota bacterium]|jgi:precorrin-6B methylase 2|nr:class I SAM-dependent methyltransferase [Bacillota bacterium]HOL09700.1 class I SAM-dependent methyltransferase [Bacillota bacterium]HPO97289.1 class I SAM-dependent methyltransferase [Bacillota bacterium]
MSNVIKLLNQYWDNYLTDLHPKDRSMHILKERQVEGMSCENVRFLINLLVRTYAKDGIYLEIGIFRGCSLLSAALYNPSTRCIGVDNFHLYNSDGKNEEILKANLNKFSEVKNVEYYNMDYREAIRHLFSKEPNLKVNVYFYDGSHSFEDELEGLNMIVPHLAPKSVIIVDDLNYERVERAVNTFLNNNPTLKSVIKIKTEGNAETWWNGIEVIVKE